MCASSASGLRNWGSSRRSPCTELWSSKLQKRGKIRRRRAMGQGRLELVSIYPDGSFGAPIFSNHTQQGQEGHEKSLGSSWLARCPQQRAGRATSSRVEILFFPLDLEWLHSGNIAWALNNRVVESSCFKRWSTSPTSNSRCRSCAQKVSGSRREVAVAEKSGTKMGCPR